MSLSEVIYTKWMAAIGLCHLTEASVIHLFYCIQYIYKWNPAQLNWPLWKEFMCRCVCVCVCVYVCTALQWKWRNKPSWWWTPRFLYQKSSPWQVRVSFTLKLHLCVSLLTENPLIYMFYLQITLTLSYCSLLKHSALKLLVWVPTFQAVIIFHLFHRVLKINLQSLPACLR